MTAKILLVNPPIYDFAAYDFWLKPYGLLTVAGYLRDKVQFSLFDFLDREHPFAARQDKLQSDQWGRGRFYREQIRNPACLKHIPRHFRRFGLPGTLFQDFIRQKAPFDFALIQTMMTYWYPGLTEVIEDIRSLSPDTKIILGGNYATLCAGHAQQLGADFILQGANLEPLWQYLHVSPDLNQTPLWEAYEKLNVGVLRLSDGCPLNCTYCSVPGLYGKFKPRPLERSLAELDLLAKRAVRNIAFYDDALLSNAEKVFVPFSEEVLKRDIKVNFHTPNALHARFVTGELADLMVRAGFKTFYLGFESASSQWHERTGSKVSSDELARAVEHLIAAGANPQNVTAYQLLGHPHTSIQELEASMRFTSGLGIRGMLADFSPIPGTPDGQQCKKWVDMDEPLFHNKTAFPIIALGFDEANRLKDLQRRLNRSLAT
jgi:hypothetical protein